MRVKFLDKYACCIAACALRHSITRLASVASALHWTRAATFGRPRGKDVEPVGMLPEKGPSAFRCEAPAPVAPILLCLATIPRKSTQHPTNQKGSSPGSRTDLTSAASARRQRVRQLHDELLLREPAPEVLRPCRSCTRAGRFLRGSRTRETPSQKLGENTPTPHLAPDSKTVL